MSESWEARGMAARLTEVICEIKGNAVCWDPKAKAGEPTMRDVSWNPDMQAGLVHFKPMTAEDWPTPPEEKVWRSATYEISFPGMSQEEANELGKRAEAALEQVTGLVKREARVVLVTTRPDGNGVTLVEETK